jgi:molybdenum cofactor cytidylyltransferase
VIARYPSHALNVDDPGVLIDVDTVADLDNVRGNSATVTSPETRY